MPLIRKVGLNVGSKPSRLLQPNGRKPNVPGRKKLGLPARKELQPQRVMTMNPMIIVHHYSRRVYKKQC